MNCSFQCKHPYFQPITNQQLQVLYPHTCNLSWASSLYRRPGRPRRPGIRARGLSGRPGGTQRGPQRNMGLHQHLHIYIYIHTYIHTYIYIYLGLKMSTSKSKKNKHNPPPIRTSQSMHRAFAWNVCRILQDFTVPVPWASCEAQPLFSTACHAEHPWIP